MKTRKKMDRIFALLLVFALIFNSQAMALLAMEGEPVTEIAGSGTESLAGTEGEAETVDGDAAVIPDGEATGDPTESGMQEEAQGGDFVLDEESVPGSDSTSGQDVDSAPEQENVSATEQESEANTLTEAEEETQINPSDSENGSGADEESGPAVDVEDDSDVTIVEEETEPQTTEQGENVQEPTVDEAETEEEYEAEVVAMGLDDEVMLTSLEGEDNEAKVIKASGSETEYATFANAVAAAGDGDTVQLLRDTAEITTEILVEHPITIDLNEHVVTFAGEKKSKLSIYKKNTVIDHVLIKGPGRMTGGAVISTYATGHNETIQVGRSKGDNNTHVIIDNAYVNGIKNYGYVTFQNNAQVSQIVQMAGTFTLDSPLTGSLDLVLDMASGTKGPTSIAYLNTGSNFDIGMGNSVKIRFSQSGAIGFGTTLLETWLNADDTVTSFPIIKGYKTEDLANIINLSNIPSAKSSAIIGLNEGEVTLEKNEGIVYLDGDIGDDSNSGYTESKPVATMSNAINLANRGNKKIRLLSTVHVKDSQEWDLEGIILERYGEKNIRKTPFVEIEEKGSLTLRNITFDGGGGQSIFSDSELIKVDNNGTLILGENTCLKNNNHNYKDYYVNGGAIYSNGGIIKMTGGMIEKCLAYNGGAIYCEGGELHISGGILENNEAYEAGGAVMIANGATMYLSGTAVIQNNRVMVANAGYGGGISVGGLRALSVEEKPVLYMTGGSILGNMAMSDGGGINVESNAEAHIEGGLIQNNSAIKGDFGGGGIYVNGPRTADGRSIEKGTLYLRNAIIRSNDTQKYAGGGIAACPTSDVKVYLANGAAIYGNWSGLRPGYDKKREDIYVTNNFGTVGIYPSVYIAEYMTDGQPYLWKDASGNDVSTSVLHKNTAISLYTETTYTGSTEGKAIIIGNHADERGGGIGTNGAVIIGDAPTDTVTVTAYKVWNDTNPSIRPEQIKVWLLQRKQGESEYECVAVEYLKPDGSEEGAWGTVTFSDQPKAAPDGTLYEYTVKEDLEGIGPYVSVVEADGENNWKITNTYTATGTAQVKAKKTLTGRPEALKDQEFSFSLAPVSAVGGADGVTVIEDPNLAQTGVKNTADGTVTFDDLTYTEAGTYTYELKEEDTSVAGVTKDSSVYTVTVTMTDDNAGHLTPSVTYSKGGSTVAEAEVIFANTYKAKEGTANVSAKKMLTGRPKDLQANEFEFSLTPKSAVDAAGKTITDPNAEQTDVKNGSDGKITFAAMTYTEAGTYTYELKETSESGNGVTVDGTVYTVTVTVTDDSKGQLQTSVTYDDSKGNTNTTGATFTNTYTAKDGKASVTATKTLTGRPNGLQDQEFNFSLTPVSAVGADGETAITDPNMDEATNPEKLLTASNDADGNVTFKELTYTQAGTYTYEMKEADTDEAGITIDPATYTVTVSVTDNNLGQLITDVKYSKDGQEVDAEEVIFANTYKPAENSIQLEATKMFDRALEGGEFTFVLQEVDQDGNAVADGVRQEKTNGSDGKILFDEISYSKEGTYYYQISETAGSDPTILSYDASVRTVTVTVEDVDAKLVATADLTADEVSFTNTSVRVKLDKQDTETGASIPGAVLRIVDKNNGTVVEQWTTDGTPHEILGKLGKNGSYALEEVSAPDGYMPTGPVDFTVNEKGETVISGQVTDTVVMKDTKNTVSLLKLDENGQPLSGAHLVIETTDGTAVDSWVSDGTPHVTRGLARGHYVLSEVEAPAGYHVAEDVPFEITGTETQPVEVQMTDKKIPEKDNNKLTVMKHLHLDGITCDIGVHDAVFYVALFDDEAKTHRVSDVKALSFKDSAVSTTEFENLGKGTYYVGETDENGVLKESEVINDRVIYYAEYGENAKVEFEGRKGEATSELTNVYVEIPEEGFYLSGRLTITKKVLLGGEEATSDNTFYAGVFSDTSLTSRVGNVVAIGMNGGSSASVTVYDLPIGETLDSSATYYVAETDENGTPLDPDAVTQYQISIDQSEVVLSASNSEQEVVITNDFVEEETETETEEETDVPDAPGTTPGSGTPAPKTGDETNYLLYLLYMALSAGLFAVAAGEKHRKRRRARK